MLQISDNLKLPLDAVTQTFGILAMRGAGKTNLARVMAEGMHAASLPLVAIDPVGSWWGLRSARDGKSPGIDIPIFGGRKGDVPLEKTGGVLIADLIANERVSCILDISEFSEGDKTRFLIDFAERLYRRNQHPLHLFLEEADDYIPQRPFREQARLLRAWENIVRRGRSRGLGMTMITQRSASINKNVLTQIETLFVLRTTSPQDRKAIAAWVEFHGQSRELLESLPGLASGEAWVWSPSWLHICQRIKARLSTTFDSGATPKDTKGKRPPATLAEIDLGAIKSRMAETIERAKADDPKELRREIAALKKQLADKSAAADSLTIEAAVDRAVAAEEKRWQQAVNDRDVLIESLKNRMWKATELLILTDKDEPKKAPPVQRNGVWAPATAPGAGIKPTSQRNDIACNRVAPPVVKTGGNYSEKYQGNGQAALGGGERRILTALIQNGGCSREQLTVLTGYKRSSRDTYLQRLRGAGLVDTSGEDIVATDDGLAALGDVEALPTGCELAGYWLARLGEGERRILQALINAHPRGLTRDVLSELTEYRRSSRDTYLQRLRSRRLVDTDGATVRASELLFD